LTDAARGHGWQPTWPAAAGMFGIPIDRILAGPGIAVLGFAVGPPSGSDHRPVTATISLPGGAAGASGTERSQPAAAAGDDAADGPTRRR
jgi:hypothetical protein